MLELTEEQLQSVHRGDLIELAPPEIGNKVVLLRADAFEGVREIWQQERTQRAISTDAACNAAARAEEPVNEEADYEPLPLREYKTIRVQIKRVNDFGPIPYPLEPDELEE